MCIIHDNFFFFFLICIRLLRLTLNNKFILHYCNFDCSYLSTKRLVKITRQLGNQRTGNTTAAFMGFETSDSEDTDGSDLEQGSRALDQVLPFNGTPLFKQRIEFKLIINHFYLKEKFFDMNKIWSRSNNFTIRRHLFFNDWRFSGWLIIQ